MPDTRPKIVLVPSKLDIALERSARGMLVVLWCLTIYSYLNLPMTIPIHFNAAGKANDFGNKATLFILPVLGTLIYIGLTQLNKYPHIFNYIPKITTENAPKQYALATRMIRFVKLAVLLIFTFINLLTWFAATGRAGGLGIWFLPVMLALLLVPIIVLMRQSLQKRNMT